MTVALHAMIPATVVYKATGDPALAWFAGLLGALPDAINNKYYHLLPFDRVYNKLHRPWLWLKGWKLWSVIATYVALFPIGLHVGMDYPVHTDDDKTRNMYLYALVESACWIWLLKWWGL